MTGRLDGRVAIITGAAGGIGGGVARRFAEEGADLVLTDIDEHALAAVADELRSTGARTIAVPCDVSDAQQIRRVVDDAVEAFSTVHVLANIAQGGLAEHHLLEEASGEQAITAFTTGPLQSMLFMQYCLPFMKEQGHGRIINTASGAALTPTPGFSTYAMAKGAVMSLTRVAAKEWGRYGITANTILPVGRSGGFDLTEQGRRAATQIEAASLVGRFGDPKDDIAPLLVFLASDESGYVTGQAIGADGGLTRVS